MGLQIIAEIGQAHDGSLGFAHSYIDALKDTQVNTIKFQMHIAHAESSAYDSFRTNFSYEDNTRIDYWKRMEFTFEQWLGLKKHCEDVGKEFLVSPFSLEAVNFCEKLNVDRYKLGSGETNNLLMIDKIKSTGKHIIISSGMDSLDEIQENINRINYENISLLHCTTSYPTNKENYYLQRIPDMKARFGDSIDIGFSDHSGDPFVLAASVGIGAEIVEFHVVFDKQSFGPDSSSSIEVRELRALTSSLHSIYDSFDYPYAQTHVGDNKTIFGKSLTLNTNLAVGSIIKAEHLETTKPAGKGLSPAEYYDVVGRRLVREMKKGEFLNTFDLK